MQPRSLLRAFAGAAALALALTATVARAEEEGGLQASQANVADTAALQRGARLFFNYCSGCHSLKYLSYSRLAEDLQLKPADVLGNFAFTGARIGDQVMTNMPAENAQQWFGKAPPDLSLEARAKGQDWIYTYLKSFYVDPTASVGWNNAVFPNASMPNPLWELQGVQVAHKTAPRPGEDARIEKLEIATKGSQSAEQFSDTARDITAFLAYAGEPAALKRYKVGVWVLLYLALFTFIAFLLKHEYWKDVH